MSEKLNIKLLLLTDVVLDKNLLERRRDAARILAMLLAEGMNQRYSGGSDILLHWTKPLTQNGDKKYDTPNGYPVKTFINQFLTVK